MRPPFALPVVVIAVAAVIVISYDVWLYLHGGPAATISWQFYLACKEEPVIAFVIGAAVGLLFGHLLWVQCSECPLPRPPK